MKRLIAILFLLLFIFTLPNTFSSIYSSKAKSSNDHYSINSTSNSSLNPNPIVSINGNKQLASYATSGNGSSSKPYIIENYIIENSSNILMEISNTNDYFILRNLTLGFINPQGFTNSTTLYLNNVTNGIIENDTISNSYFAMIINGSHSNKIKENTIKDVIVGIDLKNSKFCSIFNNTVITVDQGINLFNSYNNNIDDNNIETGFFLNNIYFTSNFTINYFQSININESNYNIFVDNLFADLTINIFNSNSTNISSNHIDQTEGILLQDSINSTIENNSLFGNGIDFYASNSNELNQYSVTNNTLNNQPIIFLENKQNMSLSQNAGEIILFNCSFMSISNLFYNNSFGGIELLNSNNNIIENTQILNIGFGEYPEFQLLYSNNNLLLNDSIVNTDYGFFLVNSNYNSLINLTAFRTTGIFLSYSNNNIIKNLNSTKNGTGLSLTSSDNQKILRSTFSQNDAGLVLESSNNAFIQSNYIVSNNEYGLGVSSSNNNSIINNKIDFNTGPGINLNFDTKIFLINNTINSNKNYGIYFNGVDNSNTTWNYIYNNNYYGIFLHNSTNDFIFLNSFVNNGNIHNTSQAYSDTNTNYFSNGTFGNYWSDYNGSGSGSSLVGTVPYPINGPGNLFDPHPLLVLASNLSKSSNNETSKANDLNFLANSPFIYLFILGSISVVIIILSWTYIDYRKSKKSKNKSNSSFRKYLVNKLLLHRKSHKISNEISDETFKELEAIIDENK